MGACRGSFASRAAHCRRDGSGIFLRRREWAVEVRGRGEDGANAIFRFLFFSSWGASGGGRRSAVQTRGFLSPHLRIIKTRDSANSARADRTRAWSPARADHTCACGARCGSAPAGGGGGTRDCGFMGFLGAPVGRTGLRARPPVSSFLRSSSTRPAGHGRGTGAAGGAESTGVR